MDNRYQELYDQGDSVQNERYKQVFYDYLGAHGFKRKKTPNPFNNIGSYRHYVLSAVRSKDRHIMSIEFYKHYFDEGVVTIEDADGEIQEQYYVELDPHIRQIVPRERHAWDNEIKSGCKRK